MSSRSDRRPTGSPVERDGVSAGHTVFLCLRRGGGGDSLTVDVTLLWRLQECETEARALEEGLARMPQALERARGEQAVREADLKARETELQEMQKKRRGLEKDVEAAEQKIRENSTRQIQARTNAELDALKKEGGYFHEQKSALETKILESFDAEETQQKRVAEAKVHLARAQAATAQRQKEIEERAAVERAALERKRTEYAGLAEQLTAPVRARFEQIARAKGGLAVVPVQRGACGGCFNALPPQMIVEIRKAEELQICEGCGRLLVWLDAAAEGGPA